jgi:hypothetical protein
VRRVLIASAAAALLPVLWLSAQASEHSGIIKAPAPKVTDLGGSCGDYGTSVHFVKTPSEAARQALKEEKLVFVLHLSGIFEDPTLT